jgi:GR25 family glycosyltransferase involved in LPS biosynthesis
MKGFYINLDNRIDRRDHFESLKRQYPFFKDIERMSAIENEDGPLGCCCSHINALMLAEKLDEPYVAIIEDDFMILDHNHFLQFINDFQQIASSDKWNVIVLTPRGNTLPDEDISDFKRIIENQTTTGYIIKKEMIPILLTTLKESASLQSEGVPKNISAIDQYWKRLQTTYPFYYYKNIFAGQLIGWSTIEKQYVDYNERYVKQGLF